MNMSNTSKAEIISCVLQANKHGLNGKKIDGLLITENRDAASNKIYDFKYVIGVPNKDGTL